MRVLGAFVGGTDPRALQVRWMPRALPVWKAEAGRFMGMKTRTISTELLVL